MIRYQLGGLKAVVTGAASGIGRATAARLNAEGVDVLGVDRAGDGLLHLDVAGPGASAAIIAEAETRLGGLDILVANAGITGFHPLDGHDDAAWDDMLAVNLSAVFRLCRAALPLLKGSGRGRIVTIGSVMAVAGGAGMAAYAASKHGVLGLTRSLAAELGPFGITANCVLPGAVKTAMTMPAFEADPGFAEFWRQKAAVKRLAEPREMAGVVAFLCSGDADFVSGAGIAVDGGAMCHP